ncbi:MAG: 5-formyltetrahydrofolate cyclo-ligase [Actinomycetes bacterium]|jgi:5-formyltetrahydrofolate cyclo-ligase
MTQNEKAELRKYYRHERELRFAQDSWLHILASDEFKAASQIASYLSYGSEPATQDLHQELLRMGKVIYLPKLLPDNDLAWIKWDGEISTLKQSGKIMEPTGAPISLSAEAEIEIVIVPALHVDREGNRLGQGGGSYDRALARVSAWKIALLHSGEITSEAIPNESHDQRVDAAATPDLIVRFRK